MARGLGRAGLGVLVVASAACLTASVLALSTSSGADVRSSTVRWLSLSKPPDPVTQATHSPARVLAQWDRRRARAYADADSAALRRLYVPGSRAGARDVRLLRSYTARGLVVDDLRMRLLSVDVADVGPHRLVLRARDRLAGATARSRADRSEHRRLPNDRPTTHVVTLIRSAHDWLVEAVR